ncbi:MAG: hypothetical protein QXM68_01140 [Candidatus Aenigmatarchaeota archaeon]|nr:hypothetical protein [Candidatus Aenigmarchaeota archaeon]
MNELTTEPNRTIQIYPERSLSKDPKPANLVEDVNSVIGNFLAILNISLGPMLGYKSPGSIPPIHPRVQVVNNFSIEGAYGVSVIPEKSTLSAADDFINALYPRNRPQKQYTDPLLFLGFRSKDAGFCLAANLALCEFLVSMEMLASERINGSVFVKRLYGIYAMLLDASNGKSNPKLNRLMGAYKVTLQPPSYQIQSFVLEKYNNLIQKTQDFFNARGYEF